MKIIDRVRATLDEDIQSGDITANLLLKSFQHVEATIRCKDVGVFCGNSIILAMQDLYPQLQFKDIINDGAEISKGDICCCIEGDIRDIVQIERTLLNFLQRLSGISTITNQFVKALNDDSIQILDTRKTTPLLRDLEKEAVLAGGGYNHRFGLYDMVLVKENHLITFIKNYGISSFNSYLKSHKIQSPSVLIEVEINDQDILKLIDLEPIDIVMLDNMSLDDLEKSVEIINQKRSKILKEVSGNITLNTIHHYRGIDIDRISIGSLTHSVKALDLSLLVT